MLPILGNAAGAGEAVNQANSLLTTGKRLLDQGKSLYGKVSGAISIKKTAEEIREVANDPNLSPAEKGQKIASIIRPGLPIGQGVIILPAESGLSLADLAALADAGVMLPALIVPFLDP